MSTVQKSIRLTETAVVEIENLAKASGREFSGLARDLLVEALKMRKCPGIVFADSPTGRRARIAGTGIDVWELVATFKGIKEDADQLRAAYHWLADAQIRAALSYYTLYPEEIDDLIHRNASLTEDQVLKQYPFLSRFGK